MTPFSRILEDSPFLGLCRNLSDPAGMLFGRTKLRPLSPAEIDELSRRGNRSDEWAGIRVTDDFSPDAVVGCMFLGGCVFGGSGGVTHRIDGAEIPAGIYYSTVHDSMIGAGALVHRCELVSRCVIDAGAAVCGSRLCREGSAPFANGTRINAGIETGGRRTAIFADMEPEAAEKMARGVAGGIEPAELEKFLAAYAREAAVPFGYVGKNSRVVGTAVVKDAFIGPGVTIEGAARISNSTIIGTGVSPAFIGAGCVIDDSIIRPGCRVDSQAVLRRAFFADGSGAERQARVSESYIGPNTVIAGGEVTASFVGPFVGFHHDALLIAAFWPDGKGNVGQGANVGSNHNSRMPDGELWPAEGMFFGLGCNIKYPADFSDSPYTVIATGVTTLPQKLEFPFSLVTGPEARPAGVPEGYNRLVPAWVLRENLYALWRNREKFPSRNRTPHIPADFDPFSSGTAERMEDAILRLSPRGEPKDVYLPGDIPGICKNFLLEKDRAAAVETYNFFIRFLFLRGLLVSPGGGSEYPADLAAEYLESLEVQYRMVLGSRRKDFDRGSRIIPDYGDTHPNPEKDEFVIRARGFVDSEIRRLGKGSSP